MYTGYLIHENRIYQEQMETDFDLNGGYIHSPDQPTGYFLAEGLLHDVKHIYGPNGYTRFYVQDGHIYGPSQSLPWLEGYDSGLSLESISL
jgi:hypothetical protein